MTTILRLMVRTPRAIIAETEARSIRVLTETGQVGLRPRMEPVILTVEPGLALVHRDDSFLYLGTAGGLLKCDGSEAIFLTPLAVAADDQASVMRELQQQLNQPRTELEVRDMINKIQSSILTEISEDRRRKAHNREVQT